MLKCENSSLKVTDFLQFQFMLLFCFEKGKKHLTQKENKNEHCVSTANPGQKYCLEKIKTNCRNGNEKFSFKYSLGNLSFLDSGNACVQVPSCTTCKRDLLGVFHKGTLRGLYTHAHSWALSVCVFDMCVSIKHTLARSRHTHVVSVKKPKKWSQF